MLKKLKTNLINAIIVFILLLTFLYVISLLQIFSSSTQNSTKIYDLKRNTSLDEIYNYFYPNKTLIHKSIFISGVFLLNLNSVQAGEYLLDDSIYKTFQKFNDGNTITHKFIIKDGMNKYQLKDIIDKSFLKNDCINFECITKSKNSIEGLLLPDTYFYKKNTPLSKILSQAHKNLLDYVDKIWSDKPVKNPIQSKYDAIILASIIEKESSNMIDKNKVGGVFLNRLNIGMKLQSDPTIIYGLLPNFDGDIKKIDILDKTNIYNTYIIDSLPSTPISMPTKTSLKAAILNEPNSYLFFVSNNQGSHVFSETYEEHQKNVRKYQLQ